MCFISKLLILSKLKISWESYGRLLDRMCLALKPCFVCLCSCSPGHLWKSKADGLITSVMVLGVAEARGYLGSPPAMVSVPHRWPFITNLYITDLLCVFISTVKCLKKFWFKNRDIAHGNEVGKRWFLRSTQPFYDCDFMNIPERVPSSVKHRITWRNAWTV